MSPRTLNRRLFERSLRSDRSSARDQRDPAGQDPARKFYYERLSRVRLRHTYYNRGHGHQPTFVVRPTPTTRELMKNLGLLFRQDATGFSVLYNVKTQEDFFAFLRRQLPDPLNQPDSPPPCWLQRASQWIPGVWTRLSFVLALTDPYFLNFTQVPIDTNPSSKNFYFSNQNAHESTMGEVFLTPPGRNRVTGEDLLNVVPSQIEVEFCPGAEQLWVSSISGEVALCLPRCFETRVLGTVPVDEIDCQYARSCPEPGPTDGIFQRDRVYVNFAKLPEDKYRLQQVDAECQPIECSPEDDEAPFPMPWEVLYTELYPMPLCFIDLLFTNPNGRQPGIYPVQDLWQQQNTRVEEVAYVLRFTRRKTWWSYYVVPQPRWKQFDDLRIESRGRDIEFAGPCCVRLPDGARAYRFVSREPLALEQHSRYHFQLVGRPARNGHEQTLVGRLPVASNRQVLPEKPIPACERLEDSLCRDQPQPDRCDELQQEVCGAEHRRNYSDIYVYI